jgi:hypothetical protein
VLDNEASKEDVLIAKGLGKWVASKEDVLIAKGLGKWVASMTSHHYHCTCY